MTTTPTLRVNELFCSPQGEGRRAGTSNIFIRLSGCNLQCSKDGEAGFDCDTEFTSGNHYSISLLEAFIERVLDKDKSANPKYIIWTGGEPLLQLSKSIDILEQFKERGYRQAVETNGTVEKGPFDFDWISCSPKTAEHTLKLKFANELRYVRSIGQGIPKPTIKADHYMISPAFESDGTAHPATVQYCIQMIKENPEWQLSVQMHKLWRVQ